MLVVPERVSEADVQALEQRTRVEGCDCLVRVSFARDGRIEGRAYSHICDSTYSLEIWGDMTVIVVVV
jgi:hypothetical protein